MFLDIKLINNFIFGKHSFCTLCFKSLDTDCGVSLTDQVVFDTNNNDTMVQILNFVFGPHISSNFPSSIVCIDCSKLVLKSFSLIKMVKDNFKQISNVIMDLMKCLENTAEGCDTYNSMYVVREKDNSFLNYFDTKCEISTASAALMRLDALKNLDIIYNNELSMQLSPCKEKKSKPKRSKQKDIIKVTLTEMLDNESGKNFKCKLCLKLYSKKIYLKRHFVRVHLPKNFKCKKCFKLFGTAAILAQHEKSSHTNNIHICSRCGKSYKNILSLRCHKQTHQDKIKCKQCERVYKTRVTFNKHIELKICGETQRKSQADAIYECDICQKRYCLKASLKNHILFEHGNRKQYVCSWCSKKFSALSRLKAHKVKHTGVKNFPCELCNKSYVSKESLLYHTRIHAGEKPFKCDECGSTFYTISHRNEHVNIHHKEPRFECKICKCKFKRRVNLKTHMRKHNDVSKI